NQGGSIESNFCEAPPAALITFVDVQIGDECSGYIIERTYTIDQGAEPAECVQRFNVAAPNPPEITSTCPLDQTLACVEDANIDPNAVQAITDCGLDYVVYVTQPDVTGAANCPGTTYKFTYKV